jgi:hypothetical protein
MYSILENAERDSDVVDATACLLHVLIKGCYVGGVGIPPQSNGCTNPFNKKNGCGDTGKVWGYLEGVWLYHSSKLFMNRLSHMRN